ncbi:hypothetical protein Kpol_1037p61, partial [Vanderwaltozyma polyspora DSM 70294]
ILRKVDDGTLNQQKLLELLNKTKKNDGFANFTFKSRGFYEKPSEHESELEEELNPQNSLVKFNKQSYLFVYQKTSPDKLDHSDKRHKHKSHPHNRCSHHKTNNGKRYSLKECQRRKPKSILKAKENESEIEESKRAIKCDNIDVESFMKYFEKIESQKYIDERKLSKIREQQLSNYYSDRFFPALNKESSNDLKEYIKSKRATEVNIGRTLDKHKTE